MTRICVFCGSSPGQPEHRAAAREFAAEIATRRWDLVYGGGNVGIMGEIANAVLGSGRRVTGVIPHSLFANEVAHRDVTELIEVDTMHERKAKMAELSDAFVALPGGIGTLEEIFEALTWRQIGIHGKPCAMLNTSGFYDSLVTFLDETVAAGFVRPDDRDRLIVADDPARLAEQLASRI